ncbi:hypothetical protein ACJ73_08353 [Blastomyces percursus]|uniref:AB hydrolase-1 domain-containing protein n=1 Tax=Blastomyces percursus TaxID=1658174 RepID=A0A1J9PWN0_9EURO|nr:hypothetical protein ACJ73_08353 [Blastomyces percursus]
MSPISDLRAYLLRPFMSSTSSRIEAAGFDELGQKYGARIIAADRPGYGWNSPHPDRTLLDHPKDLECLAKHLGLDEYCVLGISSGGPYALACAMALPREKLKCVSIVCGLGPPDIGMKGADFVHWMGFTFGWRRYARPIFIRWFFQREPAARLDLSDEKYLEFTQQLVAKSEATAHESDLKVFTLRKDVDFLRLYLRSVRESYAQGFDWVTQDGRLVASGFGFRRRALMWGNLQLYMARTTRAISRYAFLRVDISRSFLNMAGLLSSTGSTMR